MIRILSRTNVKYNLRAMVKQVTLTTRAISIVIAARTLTVTTTGADTVTVFGIFETEIMPIDMLLILVLANPRLPLGVIRRVMRVRKNELSIPTKMNLFVCDEKTRSLAKSEIFSRRPHLFLHRRKAAYRDIASQCTTGQWAWHLCRAAEEDGSPLSRLRLSPSLVTSFFSSNLYGYQGIKTRMSSLLVRTNRTIKALLCSDPPYIRYIPVVDLVPLLG